MDSFIFDWSREVPGSQKFLKVTLLRWGTDEQEFIAGFKRAVGVRNEDMFAANYCNQGCIDGPRHVTDS